MNELFSNAGLASQVPHALICTETSIACKANGTLNQVDSSLDLLISLKVPKSTRSEDPFFSSSLLPSLCVRNVGKAYPVPLLHRNVLKLHVPLHCTAVHNFH